MSRRVCMKCSRIIENVDELFTITITSLKTHDEEKFWICNHCKENTIVKAIKESEVECVKLLPVDAIVDIESSDDGMGRI